MFLLNNLITTWLVAFCMCFLGIIPGLHAQATYKVVYNVEPILATSLNDKSEATKDIIKKIIDYAENLNYVLLVNQQESSFEEEEFLIKGSENPLENIYLRGARNIIPFNEMTYVNFKSNYIIFFKNLLDKDFIVRRGVYHFNWEIKDVKKKILGFEAIKAEGQYYDPVTDEDLKVEAWFIPAIPLQSGPDIFIGLPGLIGEINLKKIIIKAKKIETNPQLKIIKPKEDKALNQKEYEELMANLRRKFITN